MLLTALLLLVSATAVSSSSSPPSGSAASLAAAFQDSYASFFSGFGEVVEDACRSCRPSSWLLLPRPPPSRIRTRADRRALLAAHEQIGELRLLARAALPADGAPSAEPAEVAAAGLQLMQAVEVFLFGGAAGVATPPLLDADLSERLLKLRRACLAKAESKGTVSEALKQVCDGFEAPAAALERLVLAALREAGGGRGAARAAEEADEERRAVRGSSETRPFLGPPLTCRHPHLRPHLRPRTARLCSARRRSTSAS